MRRRSLTAMALAAAALRVAPAWAASRSSPEYQAMIEASRRERGLLIYSNLPERLWVPFRALVAQHYPWVTIQSTDMGAELWERYYAESATGARTADLISTTAPDRYVDFIERGQVQPYISSEIDALPAWSRQRPGLYTISASPAIIMYNRLQVETPPKSIADIADLARRKPREMQGRITTYDAAANPFGTAMFATWLEGRGNSWATLEAIGPLTRPETGVGAQREKLTTGEYSVSFFANSVSVPPLEQPQFKRLIGWNYVGDGTPVSLQGAVVTKAASSPNTAKIVLDLMLSREGQILLARTGLTPYRDDIAQGEVPFNTLKTVRDLIGEDNLLYYSYDRDKVAAWPEVVRRWRATFRR